MSEHNERERLAVLEMQYKLLVSHAEDERKNNSDVHADHEKRIRLLEVLGWKAVGGLVVIQIVVSAIVALIIKKI